MPAKKKKLDEYRRKRHFEKTPEPTHEAPSVSSKKGLRFCVQKHDATRLHYDFRLEADGVLKSWAVPKGPSLDPRDKRLAMQTEDHPLAYGSFEGLIPEGEYGGGPVLLWDEGTWAPVDLPRNTTPAEAIARGKIDFVLDGNKLHGRFHLVQLRGDEKKNKKNNAWLLIKGRDEFASEGAGVEAMGEASVKTGRDIAAIGGDSSVPAFVEPELCTLVDEPPSGSEWFHEPKIDGYRLLARKEGARVQLFTRSGLDWTSRFPSVAEAIAKLAPRTLLVDGEVAVLNEMGTSSFHALQRAIAESDEKASVVFFAFDLLLAEGVDLRQRTLEERKKALELVLADVDDPQIQYVEQEEGDGAKFLGKMKKQGLEGMVSKRRDSLYVSARTKEWLKIRIATHEEFYVVGYKPFKKSASKKDGIGALLVAADVDGKLTFRGKVGTGYSDKDRRELLSLLEPLKRASSAVTPRPTVPGIREVVWVEPRVVVEVAAKEVTPDGHLRQPSFLGIRRDKSSTPQARGDLVGGRRPVRDGDQGRHKTVVAAKPQNASLPSAKRGDVVAGIKITHPDRILYANSQISKLAIAKYVDAVSSLMLPHIKRRPLALVRCPEGISQSVEHAQDPNPHCFFQKHAMKGMPNAIATIRAREGSSINECLTVDDDAGLVALVQMGALEIHTWGAAENDPETPDRVVFDLDPESGLAWSRVTDAARALRQRLADLGLVAFVKTTGGKGLHVVVPLEKSGSWDEVKAWSRAIAESMERDAPDLYTTNMRKVLRKDRIFIDYLRNGRGATAIAPYSMRARPGAPVAAPLRWDEIDDVKPGQLTVMNLHERIAKVGDVWRDYFAIRQSLPSASRTRGEGTRSQRAHP